MKKILVTGAEGQLGMSLKYKTQNQDIESDFLFASRSTADIINKSQLEELFISHAFTHCINCAAYTNVDGAEDEEELAYKINSDGVRILARLCAKYNVTLIHISTDYVFDGRKSTPYLEHDQTNPINVYGRTKLEGEKHIEQELDKYFIIRTSWLYSPFGHNFVKTIVNKVGQNAQLNIITSQTGCPTSCLDLAEFILTIIQNKIEDHGLYHYCSKNTTDWYGLAEYIATKFDEYDIKNLNAIDTYPTKAERPLYSVMDTSKAAQYSPSNDWKSAVDTVIKLL